MSEQKYFPTKFSGYYVTSDGRVFREPGRRNDSFSKKANSDGLIEVGQAERGGNAKDGRYMSVNITLKDESGNPLKQIKYYTHRLVAESLLDNPSNAETVNHIDENKKNNCVENLEWVSHADNWRKSMPTQRDYHGRWLRSI